MRSQHRTPSASLLELVRLRWSIPVLALLVRGTTGVPGLRGGGAKFATLANRAGVAPESLSRTLEALIEQGWVRRNPGYGHPMRPEYILAERGLALARACEGLMKMVDRLDVAHAALRKWSLPVALTLGTKGMRFGEIQEALPGVTPRSLAAVLKELEATGLVERTILDAYPPRPSYGLSREGRALRRSVSRIEEALVAA